MAFPEWGFILIPSLPCLVINCSYTMVLWMLMCNCSKAMKCKLFEKFDDEVRNLLPLFKEGSSEAELFLFNFRVPNSSLFVQVVNWSIIYVVLVAVAIFLQTAFVEEAQCSPVNSNLFCYLNGSNVGCSEFDYSLETANCYGITVNFGDAATNAAGVFSFYIIAFGSLTYILLKSSGGKTGHKLRFWLTKILFCAFYIVFYVLFVTLCVGIGYSSPGNFHWIHDFNYLFFMFNVSIISLTIPWWRFNKHDEERCETQRHAQLDASEWFSYFLT